MLNTMFNMRPTDGDPSLFVILNLELFKDVIARQDILRIRPADAVECEVALVVLIPVEFGGTLHSPGIVH